MVQDIQLESLVGKEAGLVLGMDVDQPEGELLEKGSRHRGIIHKGP